MAETESGVCHTVLLPCRSYAYPTQSPCYYNSAQASAGMQHKQKEKPEGTQNHPWQNREEQQAALNAHDTHTLSSHLSCLPSTCLEY